MAAVDSEGKQKEFSPAAPAPEPPLTGDGKGKQEGAEYTHPADLAELLEGLPLEDQKQFLQNLPAEDAAEAITEMDEHARVELLENLDENVAAEIVGQMSPDDAADVLDELDEDHSDSLLSKLEEEDAEEIRLLMAFDPDTAGGVMNTEILELNEHLTADEAVRQIRAEIEYKEITYYAYVVNDDNQLTGVISLRYLLTSPPGITLKDRLKGQEIISVTYNQSRNEVARLFAHYNLMAMPVVDEENRLLGAISHDDLVDMIRDLASEDMLGMVGAGQDETTDTPWRDSVLMRLPWLLVNMLNSALSACVVWLFDGTIAQMAILAVFMPMVANQAGNTGQQALAIIIRQMATEKIEGRKAFLAVLREGKIGLVNGLIIGVAVWIGAYIFMELASPDSGIRSTHLASIMVTALVLDMLVGALAGGSIPLVLKKMGRDPAQASSIFLTCITDSTGFFLFLGLATLFLV